MPIPRPRPIPFLLSALLLAAPASALAAPLARFDWSVPPRFAVPERAAGPFEVYVDGALHPDGWPVEFDACASEGVIVEYHWTIDGVPAGSSFACDEFSWSFPSEGRFTVALEVVDGQGARATAVRRVLVQDLLIFGLGDSYGSGEGAPDERVPAGAITLANAKQVAFESAQAARDAGFSVYLAALSQYQTSQAQLNAVVAALTRFLNARAAVSANCPLPLIACGQATVELTAATAALLLELGRAGLDALDIDRPASILDAIDDLRTLASAALHAAQTTWDALGAAVAAAQGELAAARAALVAGWQDASCHRSSLAAQVQAARLLEEADPRTSVTFVHVACSGATIWEGILGAYAGIEVRAPAHRPQLDAVAELASVEAGNPGLGLRRPVDAILLSIGGNDVNFAGIIERCIAFASCPDAPVLDAVAMAARSAYCAVAPHWSRGDCAAALGAADGEAAIDAEQLFRDGDPGVAHPNGLDDLPASYAAVHAALAGAGLEQAPVYLTQYPEITRDENEQVCGWRALDPPAVRQRNLLGFDAAEMAWATDVVFPELSATMEMTAGALGWRFVEAAQAFRRHGYCALEPWIVRLQESFEVQAQPWGMVHPNAPGHAAWAAEIAIAVPEPGAAGTAAALLGLAALARSRRTRTRATGARSLEARASSSRS